MQKKNISKEHTQYNSFSDNVAMTNNMSSENNNNEQSKESPFHTTLNNY